MKYWKLYRSFESKKKGLADSSNIFASETQMKPVPWVIILSSYYASKFLYF